jgi:hypothetical protein
MQIRKLGRYTFDVFQGNGFGGWSRVRQFHWGYKVVGGDRLPRNELQDVINKLERFPNGSINEV